MKTLSKQNANNLKQIRKNSGLTQEELAKRLGVSRHEICLYEAKKRKVKIDSIPKLAEILQCSFEDIVYCFCD